MTESDNNSKKEEIFARGFDGGTFHIEGGRLNREGFDDLLCWCKDKKVSDITVQSGEHVWGDVGGMLCRMTEKKITHPEIQEILRGIYGDNGPGIVNSGDDLDFAYEFKLRDQRMRFRINVTCGRMIGGRGFQITARSLPSRPLDISLLDVEPDIMDNFRSPQGLNLITGPTGSGKSTLLSSLISWHCQKENVYEKVLEYSRPVEYVYDGLNFPGSFIHQVDVGDHLRSRNIGDGDESAWAYCVRNALRRAPDIIVIGEARDKATIQGCTEASLTGHMVMSTMHTIGVADTIRRAIKPFSASEKNSVAADLLECLNLVVTQLLLPRKGGGRIACREYVVFDRKIRTTLIGLDPDDWPTKLRDMMAERRVVGLSMADSARKLLEADKITPEIFEWIASRASGESKIIRDAISGGLIAKLQAGREN